MLSSGVESVPDASVSAAVEELYTGLPESISREPMAVPGPSLGVGAQSDGPVPLLAHRDGPWASAIGNFCQKTEDLGEVLQVISHGPAESFPEELLQAGDLAEDEKSRKRHFRKLDCSRDGYQKEDEEAQGAEDYHAECCPLTLGESWSEQEDPRLKEQEAKSLRTYCTETAGSLRNTEENQANVQVTAETVPKLTAEVQVFSSVASSPEEFSKEKFKIFPSEGDKLKKDQWQFSVSDPCKKDIQENSLWVETGNIASHETGQRETCFCSTGNKIPPLSNHSCLHLSTKLEKDSPKAQLLENESESNTTSEELAGGSVGAAEADSNDSLSPGKKTNLFYTLNVTLPPVLQKSREPHYNECLPCINNEVSCRGKAWDNWSRKELIGASGTTAEQVAEVLLHKNKFKSSVNSMTFDNPNTASRVSQMNIKSSAGNMERVITGLENEPCDTWLCNGKRIKKQCTAASTSCVLLGSTHVDEVFLNSHSFGLEVDKIEENDNLEGVSSSGYNSKEAIIFPEAHSSLARGSLLCEDDWGNRGIALHGTNDIPTGKTMFCSAYAAEKSTATLARDEVSNKNMEVVEQFDLCKVKGSEIVCDRDEAKEHIGTCASQRDEFDETRAVDSPNAPEGNKRNRASEQLLVRHLNKNTHAHNFGFYNSLLGPWKRELDTHEQEEMPLLTADPSECSASTCDPQPALNNLNVPTQRAGQTEQTLCPLGNQFHPCQSEPDVPVLGSEQHLESSTNKPNTGSQTISSVERDKTDPDHSEEVLLKTGGELPLLDHKCARETRFKGAVQENVMGLNSLIGVKNEDSSGYMDSVSDLIEGKTIRLQEHENRCERNNKGALEENFSDDKLQCSQQARFIQCAKEEAELVFAGNKMQQSLPKIKWLVENQENKISALFLPTSSIHGSLSYKPENINVLSDTENRESLSTNLILNNSHPQLTIEPGKETDAQKGVGPSHFGKFDIQESCVETQADSETVSALNSHISLPEEEKLCMSPENTQRDNYDSSSAEVFSKDTSMTKILSVTISVKKKSSNIEVPSSGNESAAGSLNGAKSSRVCAHSKESLTGEGLCMPTMKDMDMSSPKSPPGQEKFKATDKPENINVLSDTENRESLSVNPISNNSCLQLTFEPGKETDDQGGVHACYSEKFDIQESCVETQADSETVSALNSHISLPEKEKLCMSPENTQRDNYDSSSAEVFSKDTSMTKILSVTISVKKKSSNIEVPSSGNESAAGSLNGAKSSRVCAHSKESLTGEGLCMPTMKDMDMSSPKSPPGQEKFKATDKPENINVLSDTENRESLSVNPISNNSCLQLTFEPGKETDDQGGVHASYSEKFDIQETSSKTWADSETVSALNSHISLPEKEKLCMSPENTQRDISSADKKFSKDTSMTKILSVTISVKKKSSNIEVPSSGNESAAGSLNGAKSSRVCTHSKESLKGEGLCTPTTEVMDISSPKSPPGEEKFKNTCVEEMIGKEVPPRGRLPKHCPWALLEDSKESGSKIVPLRTENYRKVLEEIPRSKLNNLSKKRQNNTKLPNLAGTSVLSETVHDCEPGAVSDTEAAPEVQDDTTPTFSPPLSTLSDSCKGPSPNCVVCSEVCVPYKLNAWSKDNVKEVTEGQDKIPARAVCKENGALCSERLDQIEERQVFIQKRYGKMKVHQLGKAQQEQKSKHQEKAKIILQPNMLHSSELLCSSSAELMTSGNTKFGGASEEIVAVRGSEIKPCSTLQEVKRPKITTDFISSQFLKTQDSEMESLNLNLGYDGIPGAFGTTNKRRGTTNKLRGPLPLKIQPGRTCKKVPTLYQLKTVRKIKQMKSSPVSEIPLEIFPKQENPLLESLYFPCKPPTVEKETAMRFAHMPRQRAKRCSLLNSLKFRKCTKEPALLLLNKLSAMASKLLAPAKSSRNVEPLPYSSEILPVGDRYSQCRSKNLLEAFSCINRNVHSRWADSWCTKMFSFQPLALYPIETTKILSSDLSHKPPASFLDTSVFPISFHIKLDSSPVTDLRGITSQHSVHHSPVFRETPAPASKWTLSFLLSQSCSGTTAFQEDSCVNNELHSSHSTTTRRTVAVHPDPGRNTVAGRRGGGCSTLGLHTVLALSSPGCYRIWTRRRNLTSHIPTIQRLFMSQLAQGLKGARLPRCVSHELVSSLPYSLGRVLSIWSQHGPAARPDITPLHSTHCKWQPSVGIENSCAMLPHSPVQSMGALQSTGHAIRLETSFPPPSPKPRALPESPPRLSASELQIPALDEADASVPACLRSQDDTELKKIEPEKRPKKVSQIRIRKTVPKPDPNLTPMGLPKPKRLKKKEFSLEEIYTNKNYKSPPPARSLETIFEEPKEKNGHLISVSQQKRKRILEFQDFTLPRKRKTRGKIKAVGSFTRAKRAALQSAELDVLLSQKLMDLEAFFAEEVEQEQASSI
ncbi:protein PRR14L isoform X2 [Passer montanus]|uniref:protein PRR14L isoform X2 n=1 Tax=Passer montanus TaxID=9160 RepID=UPI00195FC673|nr:protein PRR14L isoform X2 [Passer montanus]